jgi:uncharacterized protein DUF456
VILLGILGYGWLTDFQTLSVWFLVLMIVLAFLGEVFETWIGFRYAQKYGGSSRAGWGESGMGRGARPRSRGGDEDGGGRSDGDWCTLRGNPWLTARGRGFPSPIKTPGAFTTKARRTQRTRRTSGDRESICWSTAHQLSSRYTFGTLCRRTSLVCS